ncbi:hypothetical protein [Methylobacterium sp. JK268]
MRTIADVLTEVLRVLDELAAQQHGVLRAQLEAQNAALALQARTAAERARLMDLLTEVANRDAPEGRIVTQADERAGSDEAAEPVSRLRSRVAQIIVDALAEAGDAGLSGKEINDIIIKAGFTKDSSEKAKLFLKRNGWARHDSHAMHWYAPGKGPRHIKGEKVIQKRVNPENLGRIRKKP